MLQLELLLTKCTLVVLVAGFVSGLDNFQYRQTSTPLIWAVKLDMQTVAQDHVLWAADTVANDVGLHNLGQIGALFGYFALKYKPNEFEEGNSTGTGERFTKSSMKSSNNKTEIFFSPEEAVDRIRRSIAKELDRHAFVEWYSHQNVVVRSIRASPRLKSCKYRRKLVRRGIGIYVQFNDPMFYKQWHLVNLENPGKDMNVTGIWQHGVTGKNVTVAVVDDGLEWNNTDLKANYNPEGSFDLNSGDTDPSPSQSKSSNHHGTRCAGEIASVANNGVCGVGIAFGARVSGIRILDGQMTDILEAEAFTKKYNSNDVYSCSWGPEDDGKTVDGPLRVAVDGLRHGVNYGRGGYGAIYVVASGNGGTVGDNCNYDGYANSIYTVTIGAIGENGKMPHYGEECASMLAVAYSSDGGYGRDIVTTDWTMFGGTGCTESHSGTSAAAPIAAAVIALMLEVRPCLTWRDVQYIIAVAALKVDQDEAQWIRNNAGLHHSHQHGFGLMSAWRLVNTAKVWPSVPWMTVFTSEQFISDTPIPAHGSLRVNYTVSKHLLSGYGLQTLEYVHAIVSLSHARRGDVELLLVCPSGTSSVIGATRTLDDNKDGFKDWMFATVRCWGEEPIGEWTLVVTDKGSHVISSRGTLHRWTLKLFGSQLTPSQVQERIKLVEDAASGRYLNSSFIVPCPPPPMNDQFREPMSEKILKILSLSGGFLLFMALSEMFEYIFCYGEEKAKHAAKMKQKAEDQRAMVESEVDSAGAAVDSDDELIESTQLLISNSCAVELHQLSTNRIPSSPTDSAFEQTVL